MRVRRWIIVENHGTLFLLRPASENGQAWIEDSLNLDDAQYFGEAVVVEHRYIRDIVDGAVADGLEVA